MAPPTTPSRQIGAKEAAPQNPASDSAKKQKRSSEGASPRNASKSPPRRSDARATGGVNGIPPSLQSSWHPSLSTSRRLGAAVSNTRPSSTSSAAHLKLLADITVGTRIAVHWPDDDEYYPCTISAHQPKRGKDQGHRYELLYDDGETETIDLLNE